MSKELINLLVVGSGGREFALIWKFLMSSRVGKIFVAPGSACMELMSDKVVCVNDIAADDIDRLLKFAKNKDNDIGLTVVGPEQALVDGIVDRFTAEGLKIFGPSKAAARLEGSKGFCKKFLRRYGIATAASLTVEDIEHALRCVKDHFALTPKKPIVVKADGLAAGKGVTIAFDEEEAVLAIQNAMGKADKFGEAGRTIVIEEFMDGVEATITILTDGTYYLALPASQDHKARDEGDKGPNTGGMGAYAPAPCVTDDIMCQVEEDIVRPILRGMAANGTPYVGVLYVGIMITEDGPKVVEINCRFGDPETQVVIPLINNDLVELLLACVDGTLNEHTLDIDELHAAVCVVLASEGYPGTLIYGKGQKITGLDEACEVHDGMVFHAGTTINDDGAVVTDGGRVLGAVGLAPNIINAALRAYRVADAIKFLGKRCRRDIAHRAINSD